MVVRINHNCSPLASVKHYSQVVGEFDLFGWEYSWDQIQPSNTTNKEEKLWGKTLAVSYEGGLKIY